MDGLLAREILDRLSRMEDILLQVKAESAAAAARISNVEMVAAAAARDAADAQRKIDGLRSVWRNAAIIFGAATTALGSYMKLKGK